MKKAAQAKNKSRYGKHPDSIYCPEILARNQSPKSKTAHARSFKNIIAKHNHCFSKLLINLKFAPLEWLFHIFKQYVSVYQTLVVSVIYAVLYCFNQSECSSYLCMLKMAT